MGKQKLELTWIGKDKRARLEPRILLEDPKKSYHAKVRHGDGDIFDNMLIKGDNLLALKALEQDFTGKVKCVYIDPPFNTGSAFEYYDDGLEHSIWLGLMRDRLELLKGLLAEDGCIFIHIDYNEEAYLRVLLDEIFGRDNFRNTIIVSRVKKNVREREKVKALNFAHDVIIFYSKNKETLVLPPTKESFKSERWHGFDAAGFRNGMDYELFGFKPNTKNHWRWTKENSEKAIENYRKWENEFSKEMTLTDYWKKTGEELSFLRPNPKTKKPEYFIPASSSVILDTNWLDLQASGFNWKFPSGEKNEQLIQRVLEMVTNPGDLVLDSFLGSGTTAAVAHKMGRRWIGIELGEHADTHCIPRLKKVVDGEDPGGITKAVNWRGGGGFRYYTLAPSLIKLDEWGNPVINREFNNEMLVRAVCKIEGFVYAPSEDVYWKQGRSTETDFIYVTTQHLTPQMLEKLSTEVGEKQSLLICCGSFEGNLADFPNLTVKKIPRAILKKCEWNKDDYSLQIQNLPMAEDESGRQMDLF